MKNHITTIMNHACVTQSFSIFFSHSLSLAPTYPFESIYSMKNLPFDALKLMLS